MYTHKIIVATCEVCAAHTSDREELKIFPPGLRRQWCPLLFRLSTILELAARALSPKNEIKGVNFGMEK